MSERSNKRALKNPAHTKIFTLTYHIPIGAFELKFLNRGSIRVVTSNWSINTRGFYLNYHPMVICNFNF